MRTVIAVAVLVLAPICGADENLLSVPMMTVARTPRPPVIDGKLTDQEWRHAACTSGFVNLADGNLADEKTTVHVTFDNEKLYLGFVCVLTSERTPRVAERQRDGGVHADESIEVHLLPPGADEKRFYHLIFNSGGTIFDRQGTDTQWNARWQIANDAGMGYWNAEVSVPLADLGVTNLVGQTWRINFARNAGAHTSWSHTGRGYLNPQRWGAVQFIESGVIAKIKDIRLTENSEAVVEGALFNCGKQATRALAGSRQPALDAAFRRPLPKIGTEAFRQEMRPNLLPNEEKEFRFCKPSRDERRKLLQIAAATADGVELYRQAVPWQPRPIQHVELLAEPSEQTVFVRVDPRCFQRDQPLDAQIKIAGSQSILKGLTRSDNVRRLNIARWPMGPQECSYRLVSAIDNNTVAQGVFRYERRAAPRWHQDGANIGRKPVVPKPWTPIRWAGDAVEVWGRRYRLGTELILEQVTSTGAELLAAPIRLEGVSKAMLTGRKLLRAAGHECAWESTGTVGEWRVQVTTTVEFDGMIRFDLDLRTEQPMKLDALRLVIPLRADRAIYFHHAGSYYARGAAGALPSEGLRLGFWPFLWLGDDYRGLMWFAESEAGWHSDETPIQVNRAGDLTELIVHFVNKPETVAHKQFTFGLQATPVKRVPADWREWRVDSVRPKQVAAKQIDWEGMGLPIQWRMLPCRDGSTFLFSAGHTAPLDTTDALREFVNQTHARSTRIVPYLYLHGVTDSATDAARYYPFWQTSSPRMMVYGGRVIQGACAGGPFADYLLYGIEQWVKNYGVDGVYFDGAGPPVPCANPLHDHGWLDVEGKRQPVYPIFGLRDFFKRLWIMLCEHVAEPVIWVHADGKTPIPCFSFCTANYEGEMVQGPMSSGDALLSDLLPPDFWRARGQATQWGLVNIWLPIFSRGQNRLRQQKDLLATLLVHGVPCAKPEQFEREWIEPIWRAQHQFGIGRATFHPYWENRDRLKVEPSNDRVLVSFYERGGNVLLIVANLTNQPQSVSMEFVKDFNDVLTGERIRSAGNRLTVSVDAHSFRMLRTL